jgi:transposase-like protein
MEHRNQIRKKVKIWSQSMVALLKSTGQYASFVLQMECGHCGYKSPVETKGGSFERQRYACGTVNKTQRGKINVMTQSGFVAI